MNIDQMILKCMCLKLVLDLYKYIHICIQIYYISQGVCLYNFSAFSYILQVVKHFRMEYFNETVNPIVKVLLVPDKPMLIHLRKR